jgi:hypothetical protein
LVPVLYKKLSVRSGWFHLKKSYNLFRPGAGCVIYLATKEFYSLLGRIPIIMIRRMIGVALSEKESKGHSFGLEEACKKVGKLYYDGTN